MVELWSSEFELEPVPPFRLDYTVWALKRRPTNTVDVFEGGAYRRVLVLGGRTLGLEARQLGGVDDPRLLVCLVCAEPAGDLEDEAERLVRKMLGLDVDLEGFYRMAEGDSRLLELVKAFRGVKPPRFPTLFEALLNAVSCQQVSLDVGLTLLSRLAERFGATLGVEGYTHSIPEASELAHTPPQLIRSLGYSTKKAETIRRLAEAELRGELDSSRFGSMTNQEAVRVLDAMPGLGRWSAEYVLLRGLGRLDVYPGDDVGASKNLAAWLGLNRRLGYEEVQQATSRWGRFRGMVYFHLLLRRLRQSGLLA